MKIFNSMSNVVEPFEPLIENEVRMYVCGPTVYNYPHIGNARPIVVFDTLRKTFEVLGYHVTMVSNYTDVDDKIIKAAKELHITEKEVTEKFIRAYNQDRLSLHAKMPDIAPKVTETMDDIIAFIDLLVKKEYAYVIDGDVYFRVNRVSDYGNLSNQQVDDLLVGARIDENSKKENPLDFTLWKRTEEGIKWDSPWSVGRPGWHTECVVMINKEFHGAFIDIHGGGMDLKFPHHENEIAQSRAAFDHQIAKYWIHNGMVNIDGEKMSKSLGNVIWSKDMIAKVGGNVLRWVMLSAHYRAPLNINEEGLETARKEIDRIAASMKQAYVKLGLANEAVDAEKEKVHWQAFLAAMEDDLNTPNAFSALFETVKALNTEMRKRDFSLSEIKGLVATIEAILYVLGIDLPHIELSDDDKMRFAKWKDAKQKKDFELADKLRAELMAGGLL